jgi:hypothetical protein
VTDWLIYIRVSFFFSPSPTPRLLKHNFKPPPLKPTMSDLTAREVELQLSVFEMQVRTAVNDGTIFEYMEHHRKEIVSCLKIFFDLNKANPPTESFL